MPVIDGSGSRVRLVDRGCSSFENRRLGRKWRATKAQEISTQAWRIPRDKISINILQDGVEENVGVYAKEQCSIPAGMGKYIPVQTNREIQGDVLVEISKKTVPGLLLPKNRLQRQEEIRLYFYRKS